MNLPQLTFTRFIAAFGIILWHFGRPVPPFTYPVLSELVEKGSACVSYFFVLSGFILVVSQVVEGELPSRVKEEILAE